MLARAAQFDESGRYRLRLWRRWARSGPAPVFIMLNPSSADAEQDDPTIRRCIGFARASGCTGLEVVNLFAFRASRPAALREVGDPVGPDNDRAIRNAALKARRTGAPAIAAWGNHGALLGRDKAVLDLLDSLGVRAWTLGLTKSGHPRHPLYAPANLRPVRLPAAD